MRYERNELSISFEKAKRALILGIGAAVAAVCALAFTSSAAHAGPIALSARIQKEFFKAQAVVTTRVVSCFKTDPNTGALTMGMCTETVTEMQGQTRQQQRVPAAVPPPPKTPAPARR
jgi:hypothetical protein